MLLNTAYTSTFRRTSAASLVEMLVGMAIGGMVIAATLAFSLYTGRGFAGVANYIELESQSRTALDTMIRDIRQAGALTSFASNKVIFVDSASQPLIYEYSPTARTLNQTKSGKTTTLLKECDSLRFGIYKRNTTNGTFDQYPTTVEASNAKVIQVSWTCSRTITGSKLNTESVQTAKIVIRNM